MSEYRTWTVRVDGETPFNVEEEKISPVKSLAVEACSTYPAQAALEGEAGRASQLAVTLVIFIWKTCPYETRCARVEVEAITGE